MSLTVVVCSDFISLLAKEAALALCFACMVIQVR